MKTKFKHFGNSAIALVLSAIMLLSSTIVGSSSTVNTKASEADSVAVEETTPTETVTEEALTEETVSAGRTVFVDNKEVEKTDSVEAEEPTAVEEETETAAAVENKEEVKTDLAEVSAVKLGSGEKVLPEASGGNPYQVYLIANKSAVNAHIYNKSSGVSNSDWPGTAMTKIDDNLYLWTCQASLDNADSVIFNKGDRDKFYTVENNSAIRNGKVYFYRNGNSSIQEVLNVNGTTEKYTVYFKAPSTFSTADAYAHYWNNASSSQIGTKWPGAKMTCVDSTNKIYSIEISAIANRIIFNNKYIGGAQYQTDDLTIAGNNKMYDATLATPAWVDPEFTVTKTDPAEGTLAFTVNGNTASKAKIGDTVAVTATREGYTPIITVTNTSANTQISKTIGGSTSFTMPVGNVSISVAFVQTQLLTLNAEASAGGSVDPTSADITTGGAVILTASPNDGYAFSTWTTTATAGTDYYTENSLTDSTITVYPLTNNVTFNATFSKNATVHFYDKYEWGDMYAYAWDGSGNKLLGDFPGTAMTKDETYYNLYSIDLPVADATGVNIIFTNGRKRVETVVESGKSYVTPAEHQTYTISEIKYSCTWSAAVPNDIQEIEDVSTYRFYVTIKSTPTGWQPDSWNQQGMFLNALSTLSDRSSSIYDYPGKRFTKMSTAGTSYSNLYYIDIPTRAGMVDFNINNGYNDTDAQRTITMNQLNSGFTPAAKNGKLLTIYNGNIQNDYGGINNASWGDISTVEDSGTLTGTEVKVYAKSGTVRDQGQDTTHQYNKYSELSDTVIYADGTTEDNDSNGKHGFSYYKKNWWAYDVNGGGNRVTLAHAPKGTKINITTKIKPDYIEKYYVRAFVINGLPYGTIEESEANKTTGVYTCSYTIQNNDQAVEITPVYFYFENGHPENFITFYVEDFDGDVKTKWGNTIACHAWYANSDGSKTAAQEAYQEALGGYPGQPMIKKGGSYYMQIPKSTKELGAVKGITLNNYVWDDVHGYYLRGYSSFNGVDNEADSNYDNVYHRKRANAQTYDYDDFAAINNLRDIEDVIFSFKYKTYNNDSAAFSSAAAGKGNRPVNADLTTAQAAERFGQNGWSVLVDYDDNVVDLFGNRLKEFTDTQVLNTLDNDKKLFIVSDGYVNYYTDSTYTETINGSTVYPDRVNDSYLGEYATKWYIYAYDGNTYTYKGALPPSAFISTVALGTKDKISDTPVEGKTVISVADAKAQFVNYISDSTIHGDAVDVLFDTYMDLFNEYRGVPAVITYESALNSNGRYGANESNYGYRNDGRWYYSRDGYIHADTTIYILDDANGTIVRGGHKYTIDPYTTVNGMQVGTATRASACFANSKKGLEHAGLVNITSVARDKSDDFNVIADSMSEVSEDEIYLFKGWYMESGGDVLNEISLSTTGSRDMNSNASFIAVYEKVKLTDLLEAPNVVRGVVVNHNLYNEQTLTSNDPTPHNGTGKTYVESITITSSDGSTTYGQYVGNEVNTLSTEISANSVAAMNALNDASNKVVVKLRTVPNANCELVEVYEHKSSYVDKGTTMTYEYSVGDLFTSGQKGIVTIDLFSDLKSTAAKSIALEFNFYDRNVQNNTTATIKSEATTLKYTLTGITDYASLKSALTTFVGTTSNEGVDFVGDLSNVLDEYVIWSSQTQAIDAADGLGVRTYYKDDYLDANGDKVIGDEKYSDRSDFDAKKAYHTDYLGNLQTGVENWVTYYDLNGNPISISGAKVEEEGKATVYNDNVDPSAVSKISLWAFNEPKQYTLTVCTDMKVVPTGAPEGTEPAYHGTLVHAQGSGDDELFFFGDDEEGTMSYVDGTAEAPKYTGFYNQRVGAADTYGAAANGSDLSVDYLINYFGRTGSGAVTTDIAYTGDIVEAPATANRIITPAVVNESTGEITTPAVTQTYYFDGWYIKAANGTFVKAFSDRIYGNRITNDLTIYPMYKATNAYAEETEIGGATATSNGTDVYIASVNENPVKNVRLNTQLNVYYSGENIDNDDKIDQVSVIYVNLTDTEAASPASIATAGEKARAWIVANDRFLTQSGKVRKSGSVKLAEADTDNHVVIMDTYQNTTSASGDLQITLTSKNRIQFVLPMTSTLYDETYDNLIAFVAIRYNDGSTAWHVSDNYVSYVHG